MEPMTQEKTSGSLQRRHRVYKHGK